MGKGSGEKEHRDACHKALQLWKVLTTHTAQGPTDQRPGIAVYKDFSVPFASLTNRIYC